MALINISAVRKKTITTLMKTTPPGGVALFSYKRNRSVALIRQDEEIFLIKEHGYIVQEVVSRTDGLSRLLKEMIKREFPRSRKVRLVKFKDPAELENPRRKI
ncbi:hypothetical protein [Desulfogranum marinum]|uniref:hypothetical protein n=1 Tax=Desulfogranum marinum TaxID=453220 RepID=UPI001964E2B8|nr:hypothetical protein [Desulfogranum marinum]MBM9513240.1 hypothetical protein [Desulfogranum marinum]